MENTFFDWLQYAYELVFTKIKISNVSIILLPHMTLNNSVPSCDSAAFITKR